MTTETNRDPMLDMYLFETAQLIEQLEGSILDSEKAVEMEIHINEIFRIMHTIKGNSAMMLFQNISELAHSLEDLFDYLRYKKPVNVDYPEITDIVLKGIDFISAELDKIKDGEKNDGDQKVLVEEIRTYLKDLQISNGEVQEKEIATLKKKPTRYYITPERKRKSKQNTYTALVYFKEGCEMEDIRAFTIVHNLKQIASSIKYIPEDIVENPQAVHIIRHQGFRVTFTSEQGLEETRTFLGKTAFIKDITVDIASADAHEIKNFESEEAKGKKQILLDESEAAAVTSEIGKEPPPEAQYEDCKEVNSQKNDNPSGQSKLEQHQGSGSREMISVSVTKLDELMDLVGELVISEAMVTRNPELEGLDLDSFYKAARQLRKITNELQDNVMSIRMVSLAPTFQKMNRLVRDMSRKIGKEVQLELIGQETEVDKNIIEHIGDPLMHLIRNSIDHGIETAQEREAKGKSKCGKITLEARNAGGDVWIIIKDDGRGLNREKILQKAIEHGLTKKSEQELTDKDVYSFIFLPGFSTNDKVTEFSGRGVGMDVVQKNIEKVRGTIHVDSIPDYGATISIKIPLTLSIIDGMTIKVGGSRYTIPITSIKESLRVSTEEIIGDMDGNEMVMLRGQSFPITRLHKVYNIPTEIKDLRHGILIIVENDGKMMCLFADELIGEQQVVVKTLPKYIKKVRGLAGCTILGDGGISLIMDVAGLIS